MPEKGYPEEFNLFKAKMKLSVDKFNVTYFSWHANIDSYVSFD